MFTYSCRAAKAECEERERDIPPPANVLHQKETTLSKRIDRNEIRKIYPRQIISEMEYRLAFLAVKLEWIKQNRQSFYHLGEADFWGSVFSNINWLAHYGLRRKDSIGEQELCEWIAGTSGWPINIVEALWKSARNPIAHLGVRNFFKQVNIDGKATYISLELTYKEDWGLPQNDGYFVLPEGENIFNPDSSLPAQQIIFWYPTLAEKMKLMAKHVAEAISDLTDDDITSLYSVNRSNPWQVVAK